MVIILTLVVANEVFRWNLFPDAIERIGIVIILSCFFTIFASVIINIMLNIGRIADILDEKQ